MKSLFLILPVAAFVAGCSFTSTPAVVAAPSPTFIATVPMADADLDGVADVYDRYPFDSRFR